MSLFKFAVIAFFVTGCSSVHVAKMEAPITRQPAGVQSDGSFICTSNYIGLGTGDSLSKGSIHHLVVSNDFSEVQVYLENAKWEAAAPFVLKQTRQDEYTVWFGVDSYPREKESPSVAIGRDIRHATYSNLGISSSITCTESMSRVVSFNSIAKELSCAPAAISCIRSQGENSPTPKVECTCDR